MLNDRMNLREAAELLKVHVATVWRWVTVGVRGRKLGTFFVGGRRFVTREAIERFLLADDVSDTSVDRQRSETASKLLEAAWQSPKPNRCAKRGDT